MSSSGFATARRSATVAGLRWFALAPCPRRWHGHPWRLPRSEPDAFPRVPSSSSLDIQIPRSCDCHCSCCIVVCTAVPDFTAADVVPVEVPPHLRMSTGSRANGRLWTWASYVRGPAARQWRHRRRGRCHHHRHHLPAAVRESMLSSHCSSSSSLAPPSRLWTLTSDFAPKRIERNYTTTTTRPLTKVCCLTS